MPKREKEGGSRRDREDQRKTDIKTGNCQLQLQTGDRSRNQYQHVSGSPVGRQQDKFPGTCVSGIARCKAIDLKNQNKRNSEMSEERRVAESMVSWAGGDFSSLHNPHQLGLVRAHIEVLSHPSQGATPFVPANAHPLKRVHQYHVYSLSSLLGAGSQAPL